MYIYIYIYIYTHIYMYIYIYIATLATTAVALFTLYGFVGYKAAPSTSLPSLTVPYFPPVPGSHVPVESSSDRVYVTVESSSDSVYCLLELNMLCRSVRWSARESALAHSARHLEARARRV